MLKNSHLRSNPGKKRYASRPSIAWGSVDVLINNAGISIRHDSLISRRIKRTCNFHPFMDAELGTNFSLDTALRNSLIPLIVSAKTPNKTLLGKAKPAR